VSGFKVLVPALCSSSFESPSLSRSSSEGSLPKELGSKADLKPRSAAVDADEEELEEELDDEEEELLENEEIPVVEELLVERLLDEEEDESVVPSSLELLDELVDFTPTPSNIVTSSSHPLISEVLIRERLAANTKVTRRKPLEPDEIVSVDLPGVNNSLATYIILMNISYHF
jgi:hypothetical protein